MIDMRCRNCKNNSYALRDGLCPDCDPKFKAELEASRAAEAQREKHRRKLCFALRSRVLTDEEMKEVEDYDYYLFVSSGESFFTAEVKKEFESALLQQFRIRMAAAGGK